MTMDDLARVVELWTGIPAAKIRETELRQVAKLEDRPQGPDHRPGRGGGGGGSGRPPQPGTDYPPSRRPASFIFVGPTGVGKTELVKVLAAGAV